MATVITGTHEYPSSYTLSIITIMQSGNDPSFFTKRKKKIKREKEQEMIASHSEKQSN